MKLFFVIKYRGDFSLIKGVFKDRKNAVDYFDFLVSQEFENEKSLSIIEVESDFSLSDIS